VAASDLLGSARLRFVAVAGGGNNTLEAQVDSHITVHLLGMFEHAPARDHLVEIRISQRIEDGIAFIPCFLQGRGDVGFG
jgi:hypothetical protein